MVTQAQADQTWADLIEQDDATRRQSMAARYAEVAALPDEERLATMRAMATAEYALPDEKLRQFTLSRMRTWVALPDEVAQKIAAAYGAVMQTMPGPIAMKRVALVQTLVLEFTADEEDRLRQLAPGAFGGAPPRKTGLERRDDSLQTLVGKKKPFWKFW